MSTEAEGPVPSRRRVKAMPIVTYVGSAQNGKADPFTQI